MNSYQNYIGGAWRSALAGGTFRTLNPADTRQVVAEYPLSQGPDVQAALQAAIDAAPAWRATTAVARGRFLSRAGQMLEARKAQLAELLTREEGKTLVESTGEVQRAADIFRFFGGLSYTLGGQTLPHDLPQNLLMTLRQPLGVVGLITPWNFPIAIPAWKLAPALLCGNCVVLKPASLAPAMSLELSRVLHEAGLPAGALHVVVGEGRAVGQELAAHPAVAAVSFTGSLMVGQQVYQALASRMARAQMEMGGKNPTIVLADADLDLAANLVVKAAFGLTGQACTATSRVIVEQGVMEPFLDRLVARTRALKTGNGLTPGVEMGPAVSQAQLRGNLEYVAGAVAQGARLIEGGVRLDAGELAHGHFMSPAIVAGVRPDHRIACEEVFGPVVAVLAARDFDDAIALANGVEAGLSASLVTRDLRKALVYADRIEAGVVKVNQISTGLALQAPFGGVKKSSTDSFKEQGAGAIEFYSRIKTVYIDYSV
jgi:aldehyde dehydrogenase (NAD+)